MNEAQRLEGIHSYWASQFKDIKEENAYLKKRNRELEGEILTLETNETLTMRKTYSHADLRRELADRYHVKDERILNMCDPMTYLPLSMKKEPYPIESGYATSRSTIRDEIHQKIREVMREF